ncbi:uncharacterized protein METZ01_LOCUS440353, partial [marine metagenome]
AFRMIYLTIPVIAMALAYFAIRGFSLDEAEQQILQEQIKSRNTVKTS